MSYKEYTITPITKRWTYSYMTEILARELNRKDEKLPIFVGQIIVSKNNLAEYNWINKENDYERHFN